MGINELLNPGHQLIAQDFFIPPSSPGYSSAYINPISLNDAAKIQNRESALHTSSYFLILSHTFSYLVYLFNRLSKILVFQK